jgi:hypothetical protein
VTTRKPSQRSISVSTGRLAVFLAGVVAGAVAMAAGLVVYVEWSGDWEYVPPPPPAVEHEYA